MSTYRSRRVLLVEDEAESTQSTAELLSRAGYRVVGIASSGLDAVRMAVELKPDVVLMDIYLPGGIDGIEAAERLQAAAPIPVVYVTAATDGETFNRAALTDPFGYITKPFRSHDLHVAIELALRRAEVVREQTHRFSATLESVADGVIATDIERRVASMSPVAEALTLWRSSEAIGKPLDEIAVFSFDPLGPLPAAGPAARVFDPIAGTPPLEPLFLIDRFGSAIPVDVSAAPLTDGDRAFGTVVVFRDMRARRLSENALARAQAIISQTQRLDLVGQLAAGLVHDFSNLLTVITGDAEILLESARLGPGLRPLVKELHEAGNRAASLTRQMLALGRTQTLHPGLMNLKHLITAMSPLAHRLLGPSIPMRLDLDESAPQIRIDAGQAEQVLLNLVINARDAMPDGGLLTLTTSSRDLAAERAWPHPEMPLASYVVLEVADTGVGISPTVQGHIFDPFFTTKAPGKGTGLGLATVYGIVKAAEGFIYVDSAPGQGSRFRLYFPVALPNDGQIAEAPGSTTTASPR